MDWHPMETAPKDGTWFLWGQPEGNPHCCVIRWPEYKECWTAPGSVWMPLPLPPGKEPSKLRTIQKNLASTRDKLREQEAELAELLSEGEEVHGTLCDALESVEYAVERLSEYQ